MHCKGEGMERKSRPKPLGSSNANWQSWRIMFLEQRTVGELQNILVGIANITSVP